VTAGFRHMAADLVLGYGRIVAAKLGEVARSVLVDIRITEESETDPNAEESLGEPMFGPLGLVARPRAAVRGGQGTGKNPEGSCEVIGWRIGDNFQPLAYRDLRLNKLVNPKEGEVALVQYGGGLLSLAPASDGSGTQIAAIAPKQKEDGAIDKAHALILDPAQPAVALVHMDGMALTMASDAVVLKNKAGDASVLLDDGGAKLVGSTLFLNGSTITIYAPNGAGLAATKAHVLSMEGDGAVSLVHSSGASVLLTDKGATVRSDTGEAVINASGKNVTIKTSGQLTLQGNVMLGGAGGEPVMKATQLMAWVGQVTAAINALNTLLVTTGLPVVGGGGGTAKAAAGVTVPAAVPTPSTSVTTT
jgi:hypothetical protein